MVFQITITLTEGALMIFIVFAVMKNCWHVWGFELATLDISSQSGTYDLSAMSLIKV